MSIEERMDKIEAALGKQDALVIELRDAVTVTLGLEAKHGRMMKDHAEWLIGHDQAMNEFREQVAAPELRRREQNKELDGRIARLVSGFGEFPRKER